MSSTPSVPPISQIGPGLWESSQHLLYGTDDQTDAYDRVKTNRSYNSFHLNTTNLMRENAAEICQYIGGPFTLIDLGPAYPDKTLPLMRYAKRNGKPFEYVAVDINEKWMHAAEEAAKPYAKKKKVYGVNTLFQECAAQLPSTSYDKRLVFIGLTFMNFEPSYILGLMKTIAGPHGLVGIAQELIRDDNAIEAILDHYRAPEFRTLSHSVLKNLGVDADRPDRFNYDIRFENKRVEIGFVMRSACEELGLRAGDRLVTLASSRRTPKEFYELLYENDLQPKFWISPDQTTALAVAKL